MILILRVEGEPVRQFHRDPQALPYLDPKVARHALLRAVSPLKSEADGAAPSLSLTLDNSGGELSRLFAYPPLGAAVRLLGIDGGVSVEQFAGIVDKITLTATDAHIEAKA